MQLQPVNNLSTIFLPSALATLRTEIIPGINISLEELLDKKNSFFISRSDDKKTTTLRVDINTGQKRGERWRIIRKQMLLPQVSPQQPPAVSWFIEKGKNHRSNNISMPLRIPNINRIFQRIFAENGYYLI